MAWYPKAVRKPLRENTSQPRIRPRAIILHTAVSDAHSLFNFFQNSSNLESHFYVRQDGIVEQYIDTVVMADANKDANDFAVSIETWDGAAPDLNFWNARQMAALTDLCDWLCRTHAIPRVKIPTWNGTGIGWHVMFGAPGPWTPVSKSCPGKLRISQMPELIRRIQQKGTTVTQPAVNPWTFKNDDALADAVPDMVGKDAYALLMRTCDDTHIVRNVLGRANDGVLVRLERIENLISSLLSR